MTRTFALAALFILGACASSESSAQAPSPPATACRPPPAIEPLMTVKDGPAYDRVIAVLHDTPQAPADLDHVVFAAFPWKEGEMLVLIERDSCVISAFRIDALQWNSLINADEHDT